MMQQYWKYRNELPEDTLLLFRLGDFYEMFHQDAEEGSRILGITLTKRQNYPMAGIPYHAAVSYIPRLLAAGCKVAIVDQIEAPQAGKLVKRALTRILTPGTTLDENQLDARRNHYLFGLNSNKQGFHAAWLDLSTGDFQLTTAQYPENLLSVINSIAPKEIILPETNSTSWAHDESIKEWYEQFDHFSTTHPHTLLPDFQFEVQAGAKKVKDTLKVLNLDGFGIPEKHPALGVAGALIDYATENLCQTPQNLRQIKEYRAQETLLLDPATLRNLEIFQSAQNTRTGSLLDALDKTVTAAGARLLEQYLAAPLRDVDEIQRRQQCIADFIANPGIASGLQESLSSIRDIPRILGRLQNKIRNPRELGGIRDTINALPAILEELQQIPTEAITEIRTQIFPFDDLRQLLSNAVADELPSNIQDGNVIRDGYNPDLDYLRSLTRDNKTWIADLEKREQESTGIKKLKIKYNGSFGYFIEVTKANLNLVPEHYIRRQTMTNAERYATDELREKEKEILHAEEKAIAKESELFQELIQAILKESDPLQDTAFALSELDLFIGWSQIARQCDYCRPTVDEGDRTEIEQGRHPVVEQILKAERHGLAGSDSFVPNDTWLSSSAEQIALITGPNMAGKSTFIRQVALITLMAQIGCYVPAKNCHIGLVDRIFSRVGASDELARGNSTFMVEMNETANILNNATEKSLIILDEIGRGTSTYDGLSIAWAVIEYLHGTKEAGPRTLFATHYHEVTQLEKTLTRLRNYSVSVKEWNDEIIFVRQVIPGAADRSYGIQVARLAGLPGSVIERANVILDELETEGNVLQSHLKEPDSVEIIEKPKRPPTKEKKIADKSDSQMELF